VWQLWEEFQAKVAASNLSVQVEWQHAKQQAWMRIEGALSSVDAEGLGRRIQDALARGRSRLVLDLKRLQWDQVGDLGPLRELLIAYRSRIRVVLPERVAAHPEVLLLANAFQHY
jgi:hypothetical protein